MGFRKLYRVPANLIKRKLEGDRPDAPDIEGAEGADYSPEELVALSGEHPGGGLATLALSIPTVYIPTLEEIARYHNQRVMWYPWAKKVAPHKARGKFNDGYPAGAIYHYNAGRDNPVATMDSGRKNGFAFSACGRFGEIIQANSWAEWGYHAGKSAKKIAGKLKSGVSAFLHGIEVSAAGTVEPKAEGKFAAYFHKKPSEYFTANQVRKAGPILGQLKGSAYFHRFAEAQELSMQRYLLFMKVNNPKVFQIDQIYGHDEVATPFGRKVDPGGCLSVPMDALRTMLEQQYNSLGLKKL